MESSPPGASPPEWMQTSETSLADGARKHVKEQLKSRSSCFSFFTKSNKDKDTSRTAIPPPDTEPVNINFFDQRKKREDENKFDQFRWAVLYENQRGITIFSKAYYSNRSLLPHDPPSFTVPDPGDSSPSRHPHHSSPNVTLTTYPLPDPTWRWVSRSWLVDMRGDGDVQHDGFEYNWFFRRAGWRARVGWFSAGGYVRRRRWVRLMIHPSEARLEAEAAVEDRIGKDRSDPAGIDSRDFRVWQGDDGDWDRVRKTLKDLGRDGPRLDLWTDWLIDLIGEINPASDRRKEWANDDSRSLERPCREWVLALLWGHGQDLRNYFVYPDSRAQLRDLFVQSGLVTLNDQTPGQVVPSMAATQYSSELPLHILGMNDFWSRSSGLNLEGSTEDLLHRKREVEVRPSMSQLSAS